MNHFHLLFSQWNFRRWRLFQFLLTGLLWLLFQASYGQANDIQLINPFVGNQQMPICSTDTVEFPVVRSDGNPFQSTDSIRYDLQLPSGLQLLSAHGPGLTVLQQSGNSILCNLGTTVPRDTFKLKLAVEVSCDFFSSDPTQVYQTTGDVYRRQSGAIIASQTLTNRFITIEHGVLTPLQVVNRVTDTPLNGKVERCFYYMNTSTQHDLTADIVFEDSILLQGTHNWVAFTDAVIQPKPWLSTNGGNVTDSVINFQLSVVNMPPLDTLVICDSIQLQKCPSGVIDSSQTEYSLRYGCLNDTLCQNLADPLQNLTSVTRTPGQPNLQFQALDGKLDCPADSNRILYKVWNSGSANAFGAGFTTYYLRPNRLTDIDTTSVQLYGLDQNGNKLPYNFYFDRTQRIWPYVGHASFEFHIQVDTIVAPGDTLYIEYREFTHCPDTMDHDALLAWNGVYLGTMTLMGQLEHDCLPATKRMAYNGHQYFRARQFFDNLLSTMADGQQEWFHIQSTNPLLAHRLGAGNGIVYDPTRFRIEIDLTVDSGLCFANGDSVYLYGNVRDTIIWPESTTLIPGNGGVFCTNDTLRAVFALSSDFIASNGQLSPYFFRFFNDYQVRFRVRSDCNFVNFNSGERPKMQQTMYVTYDTACAPNCRIPINRVGESVQINCPGCYVPGWNLSSFEFKRLSLGESDTNDNHFPDFVPVNAMANPSDVDLKQIMIGDTVAIDVSAFVSDGSPVNGYTFSMLTFPFDHGVFFIPGNDILKKMDLIGIELNLTNGTNPAFTTVIQANNPTTANLWILNPTTGAFSLDLDSTAWWQLGHTAFTSYGPNHALDIRLVCRVNGNLTDGAGLPGMGVYEAAGFIYMSGTPFNLANPQQKPDVLNIDRNDLRDPNQYSMADLEQLLYWCTGWEGRVRGIGVYFSQEGTERPIYYKNICDKAIWFRSWAASGQNTASFVRGWRPAAYDVFPNELRNIYMLDSLVLDYPSGYRVTSEDVTFRNLWNNGNGNTQLNIGRPFPASHVESRPQGASYRFFDLPNRDVTEPTLRPDGTVENAVYASYFGESKVYVLTIELRPEDCAQNLDSIETLQFTAYYQNDPETNAPRVSTGSFNLKRPTPVFQTNVSQFQIDNTADLSFNFNLRVTNIHPDVVPNVFFYGRSQNGTVSINSMMRGGGNVAVSGAHLGQPIYNLGTLTGRYPWNNFRYAITADYDCAAVDSTDTLILYYGYSCDSAVTSFDGNWCQIDSIKIPINYQFPGLQANTVFPDTVNTCDTVWYAIDLNATGNRRVEQVMADLTLPPGITVPNLSGGSVPEARLYYDGTMATITSSGSGAPLTFDLTQDLPDFIGTLGKTASLRIPMLVDCSYQLPGTGLLEVTATDFCGKSLQNITANFGPAMVEGTFDYDEIDLFALQYTPLLTCQDSGDYSISLQNQSAATSGLFRVAYYCEGDVSGPVQPWCFIGSTAPMQLAGNSTQTIVNRLAPNCPDCEEIVAVLEPLDTCNCGNNTDTLRTQVNCDPCVMQADYTYSVTEGCVLNFFDQSTGTQSVGNYTWLISDRTTGMPVANSNQQNPVFAGLTTHYLEVCLVITGSPDTTCGDTVCYPIDLCCVPEPDTCIIDPIFSVTGNQCQITLTDFSSITTNGTVSYEWSVRPPGASAFTVYPLQANPVFNYQVAASGVHDVCLKVITSDGCEATICKSVPWAACPDLCNCDGEIVYTFDSTECRYDFSVSGAPAGLIDYLWEVTGPTTLPAITPNATAAAIGINALENGTHQVCVTLTWVRGLDTCVQRICRTAELNLCPPDCEFSANIGFDVDSANCVYDFYLVNAPTNVLSYAWSATAPNTAPIVGTPNGGSTGITPQATALHTICVAVSWLNGNDTCYEQICTDVEMEVCPEPCAFDGSIVYELDSTNCIYDFTLVNGPANVVTYSWSVNAPNTNPLIVSPNAPSVNITPQETALHSVCLEVYWLSGTDTCFEQLCTDVEMEVCPEPCAFDGSIGFDVDPDNCIYDFFVLNAPANVINYTWTATAPNMNPIVGSPNGPSTGITPLETAVHTICVTVSWLNGNDTCTERICRRVEMTSCGSDCKFEGELEVGFDDEKCLYQFALGNAPANVISYNWTVSAQNTSPMIQPNANAAMIGISPLETGVHTICVTVTWTDGADTCRERICYREELKRCSDPCEYQ
ncbi:MAG: hypothetical protein ACFB10_19335, partial [Salibacteraceae bacterium]